MVRAMPKARASAASQGNSSGTSVTRGSTRKTTAGRVAAGERRLRASAAHGMVGIVCIGCSVFTWVLLLCVAGPSGGVPSSACMLQIPRTPVDDETAGRWSASGFVSLITSFCQMHVLTEAPW